MKIFNVGPDELQAYELKKLPMDFDWFIYWYEAGSYDGLGYLIGKKGDEYSMGSLSHCSCYGPTDNLNFTLHSKDAVLADLDTKPSDYDYNCMSAILSKMKELENED